MLLSMTGQGDGTHQVDGKTVVAEIRTVNSRYFKANVRVAEGLYGIEPRVENLLRKNIRRGAVHTDLRLDGMSTIEYRINEQVLANYRGQLHQLGDDAISLEALLALPGVVDEQTTQRLDGDAIWNIVEPAVQQALEKLARMRADEGQAMQRDLIANCSAVRKVLHAVREQAPSVAKAYAGRLTERINKLLEQHEVAVQPSELAREVGIFAERSDISEEVVRLDSHIDQFLDVVDQKESNGRKLDFLTQEMFRETNTIGAKANDAEISRNVVEMKALIERMREMIQNIE